MNIFTKFKKSSPKGGEDVLPVHSQDSSGVNSDLGKEASDPFATNNDNPLFDLEDTPLGERASIEANPGSEPVDAAGAAAGQDAVAQDPGSNHPDPTPSPVAPTRNKSMWGQVTGAAGATIGAIGTAGRFVAKPFTGPKPLQKRPLFWVGTATGLGALALGGLYLYVDDSVKGFAMDTPLSFARPGTLTIKGRDGTNLLQLGSDTSETLKLWQFPVKLKQAFIAIEDRRFYEHDGVDYRGITRAVVSNISSREIAEGASSITQQVARMVYLDQDKNFWRKLKEIRLAQKVEKALGKDQIIERYLNLVYLGEGTYGAADAAWVYFGKTVDQLTLPQMAMLAALPPAPNKYSPFVNPKFAQERRNLVLQRMQEAGFITAADMKTAQSAPLGLKRTVHKQKFQQARYFTKYVEQELATGKYVKPDILAAGGLTVETTLDPQWQTVAEEVVQSTVRNNRGSFSQAAMVSLEPRSGAIRAMVGGKDFENNQFNRVIQAKRQPGSTFKPIVYAAAIAGGVSPNKGYVDAPLIVDGYKPQNASKSFKGNVSMRSALTNSINIVAIKILIEAGFQPVMDLASKMGITSELKPYYSLALGGLEVDLLELTNAYATFAAQGIHEKPHSINRIVDRQGKVLYEKKLDPQKVLTPNNTAIVTSLMRDVVTSGTGTAAQLSRPVAGKTGTTDKERDLWFMGYIPQLVTGVWLGNDNNRSTGNASSTAAYAWRRFMQEAVKDMPVQNFLVPDYKKQKAEIKLDPVRPGSIKSLPVPKDGKDTSEDDREDRSSRRRNRADSSSSEERAPRQRSRAGSSSEERAPRQRYRADSEGERPTRRRSRSEDAPAPAPVRRSSRASSGDDGGGSGESRPVRRRSSRSDTGGGESRPARRRSAPAEGGGGSRSRRASEDEG